MKVVLINHSDSRGGASVVTVRLLNALLHKGIDARMLVVHQTVDSDRIRVVGSALRRKACFLYEHAYIYAHNGFTRDDLFKVSAGVCGLPVHQHPWVREADVVVLNWINQGMLSLDEIARIQAPVVWTMHDMWCMTGVCHHAGECQGYRSQCGDCPMLHAAASPSDMSHRTLLHKSRLYGHKPIHFVAVSKWLAQRSADSTLLGGCPVSVIPNAFPVDNFSLRAWAPRSNYRLPEDRRLIVMGAARLDDPIKGLDLAVSALNRLTDTDAAAVFFGEIRDQHALDELRLPYVALGTVTSHRMLNDIYAHGSVVLSSSHYETLPGTLIEGMASGCVPVTFGRGGQSDIVDHLQTGYIARFPDVDDLANGLRYALDAGIDRQVLRDTVQQRFASHNIADRYIALFKQLAT